MVPRGVFPLFFFLFQYYIGVILTSTILQMTHDASYSCFGCLCQEQRTCICRVSICYRMDSVFFKIRFIEFAHLDLSGMSPIEITPLMTSHRLDQIAIVPQLAVGLYDLILGISSAVSLYRSWAFDHSCCLCSNPITSRKTLFLSTQLLPLALTVFSSPLPPWSLSLGQRRCHIDVSFTAVLSPAVEISQQLRALVGLMEYLASFLNMAACCHL